MEIKTPDIGVDHATVAEILVKVGDTVAENDSIVVVESDKASVEVPSPSAGVVTKILIKDGDEISQGTVLIELDAADQAVPEPVAEPKSSPAPVEEAKTTPVLQEKAQPVANQASQVIDIKVPDIGVEKAAVGEILVQVGDTIALDDSIVVVESDKATVEVPSTAAGQVESIEIKEGDIIQEGVVLIRLKTASNDSAAQPEVQVNVSTSAPVETKKPEPVAETATKTAPTVVDSADKLTKTENAENAKVYAGPAVRKLARELGVLLSNVKASGPHARIMKDDVFAYVKQRLTEAPKPAAQSGTAVASGLPKLPDFSAYGGVEEKPLTRLQQVSVPQLCLNNFIPQVTQFDQADITALEAWRGEIKGGFKQQGISLTILAFIAKAVAHLLQTEPYFAGHLSDDQKTVLLRKEIHMGIAVATPDGLTVPVLRHPDQKSIKDIAVELGELSKKAREKKLSPKDLQGANFTITSLGSIGGTAFTPLVNWPQVAILGISPATMQPVWNGKDFEPRLMLPLSLSYDHRVINGADAARFSNKLTKLLADIRSLLL